MDRNTDIRRLVPMAGTAHEVVPAVEFDVPAERLGWTG